MDQIRITESPFSVPYPQETFKSIPAKCSLLDLHQFDEGRGLENYKGDVRRAIRKAQKNGLFVRGTTSREEAKIFYQLYLASMERNRTGAKYPFRWFQALYDLLILRGKADIRFAMKGTQYVAGVVLVYSSNSIHYLHNGSDQAQLENRPNDLIVDDIVQRGIGEGKGILDFMGSDREDLSLLRFKEKWGSRTLDIHTFVRDCHPIRCLLWETGKRWMASRAGARWLRLFRR
jgi:lipid II:glycine glycyltransferase (peptidoglycan interpeptide bridge formation enzyme)